jgi:hypothetical protein
MTLFASVPQSRCWDHILKWATTVSFYNLPSSPLTIFLPFDAVYAFQLTELHLKRGEPERKNDIFLLFQCLVFIELPYSEDMREFVFPPIISDINKPTKEQLDSVDALIDNMDLRAVRYI